MEMLEGAVGWRTAFIRKHWLILLWKGSESSESSQKVLAAATDKT